MKRRHISALVFCVASFCAFFCFTEFASAATIQTQNRPWAKQSGLIGYWNFDAKNMVGSAITDSSGTGNNGIIVGSPSRAPGKIGQALRFNGSSGCASTTPLENGLTQLTVSAWIRQDSNTASKSFVSKWGAMYDWVFYTTDGNGNSMSFNVYDSGGASSKGYTGDAHSANIWEHWVAVYDGTLGAVNADRLKIYKDGIQQELSFSGVIPAATRGTANNMHIGCDADEGAVFDGLIDEVRIYNRALTAQEVRVLYGIGQEKVSHTISSSIRSGLVGWWTFDGNEISGYPALGVLGMPSIDENGLQDVLTAQKVTTSNPLTVTGMQINSTTAGQYVRFGIYDATGPSGQPGNLLGEIGPTNLTYLPSWLSAIIGGPYGAVGIFPQPIELSAGDYWIAFLPSSTSGFRYENTGQHCYYSYTYGALPSTFSASPTCGTRNYGLSASVLTALDRSGNSNVGKLISHPSPTLGKVGQALNIGGDAATQYVSLGDLNSLDGLTSFSVSAWAKTTSATEDHVFDKSTCGGGGTDGLEMVMSAWNAGKMAIAFHDAGTSLHNAESSTVTNDGAWHHYVGTYDGTDIRMWVDGVNTGTTNAPGLTVASNAISADIGGWCNAQSNCNSGYCYWNGGIDDVRVYSRALSTTEIKQLFNEGQGTIVAKNQSSNSTNGLVGYWSFNGPDLTDKVYDRSTQGNNGYFNGTATSSAKTIGKIGQALAFNNTTDYISLPNAASLKSNDGTFSAWVKTTTDDDETLFAASHGAGTNIYSIELGGNMSGSCTNELISLFVDEGAVTYLRCYQTANRSELFDGNWHHIAVVATATTMFYLDGESKSLTVGYGTDDGKFTNIASIDTFRIGNARYSGSDVSQFGGSIDEARIYNRGLSAAEVKQLYNLGR